VSKNSKNRKKFAYTAILCYYSLVKQQSPLPAGGEKDNPEVLKWKESTLRLFRLVISAARTADAASARHPVSPLAKQAAA
jgi:hypothetical protein